MISPSVCHHYKKTFKGEMSDMGVFWVVFILLKQYSPWQVWFILICYELNY